MKKSGKFAVMTVHKIQKPILRYVLLSKRGFRDRLLSAPALPNSLVDVFNVTKIAFKIFGWDLSSLGLLLSQQYQSSKGY